MDAIKTTDKYILKTYNRYPYAFKKGCGAYLFDKGGHKYLDMGAGIAVSSLGHSHPAVVKAIKKQADKLLHTSNLYYSIPQAELAKKLVRSTDFSRVFFCNSGAEANEAALKLARKYGKLIGNENKIKVISMDHSFHGRTMATVTATGQKKYQAPFLPLVPGFEYATYNDIDSVKALIDDDVCAVIMEPLQGEGGVHPATLDFVKGVRELCDKHQALLIFDEVQTGMGRTGTLFCYEQFEGIKPDLMTTAKGIAAGLPMGALFVSESLVDVLQPGDHASTFGGNPLCASAAIAVVDTIRKEKLLANVLKLSNYFMGKLAKLQARYGCIKDIRGKGFLIGIEIDFPASELVSSLLEHNIITVPAGSDVVRFLPPLIITKRDVDFVIDALDQIFNERN